MYNCDHFVLLKAKKLREYNPTVYGIYKIAYLVWMISNLKEEDTNLRKDVESCGW